MSYCTKTQLGLLRVEYWPEWDWGEFIIVFDAKGEHDYETMWESGKRRTQFHYCRIRSRSQPVELPPPSETLLSLLRHFHEHRAVAPLLDRLLEEYPQLEEWVNPAELLAVATDAAESVANGVAATA